MVDEFPEITISDLRRRRSAKWTYFPASVLPAFVAEMDFPLAAPIKRSLVDAIEIDDTGYANPAAGNLAGSFAGFAERHMSWAVDPEQVVATTDVVGGIVSLLRHLAEPGNGVIITPPVYHPFFSIVEEVGCKVVEAPMSGGRTLDLDAIEAGFESGARILILCSPHNPAGSVPTRDELVKVAELAERFDAWVISDEIHSPLTLPGATHTPFLAVSDAARERGICLISASKTFNLAGLGCALFVTASDRAAAVIGELPFGAKHPGHLGAIASETAFSDADEWLARVIRQLDFNRGYLAELLADALPEVGYVPPEAGYLAWLDFRVLDLGDDPSEKFMQQGHVALSPGPTFGSQGKGFARLNIGTRPEFIEAAVNAIAKAAPCG